MEHPFFELFNLNKRSDHNKKIFTPVIHLPESAKAFETGLQQAVAAEIAGADGVILISHGKLNADELTSVWQFIDDRLNINKLNFPIGVNWLDMTSKPEEMIFRAHHFGIQLVWSDATNGKEKILAMRRETAWDGFYCGAVAFKYQEPVSLDKLPEALENAYTFMNVPITSGDGTNIPIDMEKARLCRKIAKNRPLGIASGVSMANIQALLPLFDWFLVSSSLSLNCDWYRHDPQKVKEMAKIIHSWKP